MNNNTDKAGSQLKHPFNTLK